MNIKNWNVGRYFGSMNSIWCFLTLFLWAVQGQGQIFDPVTWHTEVEQINGDSLVYELRTVAKLEAGWHLYGQEIPKGGPVATTFKFSPQPSYSLLGKSEESKGITQLDKVFKVKVTYFEGKAVFKQRIVVKDTALSRIKATVTYMVCDDTKCLPPSTQSLTFTLKHGLDTVATDQKIGIAVAEPALENKEVLGRLNDAYPNGGSHDGEQGLWGLFFLSFLGGLAALFTPCVFPMVPLTVSVFVKRESNQNGGLFSALLFAISIVFIYVVLGLFVSAVFGADALNQLSTSVAMNLIFFVVLVFFALSFFGAFEMTLPSSWATKMDVNSQKSGYLGIFFMALALAIVSFSCTGPIVGTLLVQAASEGGMAPIVGMLGFATAIALPFGLFATFPRLMASLPRSGSWLNTVKVSLGFLELALAFKFLSNADMVLQLHWFEREAFLAIWIAIFSGLALYLFGKIRLLHDAPMAGISPFRLSFALLALTFTLYLLPGLWGAPLKLISGFPPPMNYSEAMVGTAFMTAPLATTTGGLPLGAKEGPLNLLVFEDYDQGMAYAKKEGKPIFLDFTGYACVNCRKMEERVWPMPQVLPMLKEELVIISLYVDDKRPLPKELQYTSASTGKLITTYGNKWSDLQITAYGANAQPYYVLLDHTPLLLNEPKAYEPNAVIFGNWLRKGILQFKKNL